MRIALIVPGFSQGSDDWAIPALLTLARALAQENEVHIFSQRYPAKGIYHFDGLIHHALGGGQRFGLASLWIWLQTARAVMAQHRQTPFDLLHAFWADEAGFSAAIAGAAIKRPVVVSLGGGELISLPHIGYGARRFLTRRMTTSYALRRATRVTTGSKHQLGICRAHQVPAHKLRLAPPGVDTELFRPGEWATGRRDKNNNDGEAASADPNILNRPPTLVQAASLLPVKNQALLLETIALVKQEMPDIRVNLAGTGPLQTELMKLAQSLDISQNICWQQQMPYLDMPGLYQKSHLYLQTSYHESQGMAVLEAMACGLPVLGTPVGVVEDLACRPASWSKEVLAAQVSEIFKDKPHYLALRRQARQEIEERFSLPVTTQTFQKIYQEALNVF